MRTLDAPFWLRFAVAKGIYAETSAAIEYLPETRSGILAMINQGVRERFVGVSFHALNYDKSTRIEIIQCKQLKTSKKQLKKKQHGFGRPHFFVHLHYEVLTLK